MPERLLCAVGLMPDEPGSAELAYWTRPEERGRGLAAQAVAAVTRWAHDSLAIPRIWLEINSANEPSLRLARRAGYRFEQRLPGHCRNWSDEDAIATPGMTASSGRTSVSTQRRSRGS